MSARHRNAKPVAEKARGMADKLCRQDGHNLGPYKTRKKRAKAERRMMRLDRRAREAAQC